MNYREILDAALAAMYRDEEQAGQALQSTAKKNENAVNQDEIPLNTQFNILTSETSDDSSHSNSLPSKEFVPEFGLSEKKSGEALKNSEAENNDGNSLAESVRAIEKATDLIKQIRTVAVSARNDLDFNHAKQLDDLTVLLEKFCKTADLNAGKQ